MDVESSEILPPKNTEEKCDDNYSEEPNSPTDKDDDKFSNTEDKGNSLFIFQTSHFVSISHFSSIYS